MDKEIKLAEAVLRWWEEHQYDCVSDEDDEYNVYDEPPHFVKLAQELLGRTNEQAN